MRAPLRKQLQKFTRREQMRIWLKRVACRMPPLYWWSAGVLFLGGFIHQLMLPLSLLAVGCIAILPSLLIFSWLTVTERPTAEEGAAAADRLFRANSLFVSAWELSRSTTATEGIAPLLSARTETALPDWHLRIKQQPRQDIKPASLIAATLALVGLFFLLLPPHVQIEETAHSPYTEVGRSWAPCPCGTCTSLCGESAGNAGAVFSANTQRVALNQVDEPAMVLSELFMESEKTAAEVPEPQYKHGRQQDSSSETPPRTRPESAQAASPEISENLSQSDGLPYPFHGPDLSTTEVLPPDASKAKGKKMPGQTPGNEIANTSSKVISKGDKFDQIHLIDVETGADVRSTAFDGAREGSELIVSKPKQSASRQSAPGHSWKVSRTDSATLLTAQQRTSVRRYFKQLEKIDESNE